MCESEKPLAFWGLGFFLPCVTSFLVYAYREQMQHGGEEMHGQNVPESGGVSHRQQKYILVAEDDEAIQQFVLLVIEQETPYIPLWAITTHDALRLAQEYLPVLFLLDYHLPSMTGLQLYDQFHDLPRFKTIPAILMSACPPWAELKRRGIFGLDKPFDLDELLLLIERVVEKHQGDEEYHAKRRGMKMPPVLDSEREASS